MIDLNGIAHTQLTVSDMTRSRVFYHRLLHELFGMKIVFDFEKAFYCVGGRTGLLISPVDEELKDVPFNQRRVGLHHLCFRLRSREDIEELHGELVSMSAKIVHAPQEDEWAPGYYSILFEDPDGIRLEANFVPGKGHLEKDAGDPPKSF